MITFIRNEELEQIARRVWYAKWGKAGSRDAFGQKRASFGAMGYHFGAEFPMHQGEWVRAGKYDIMVTYQKWDIPSYIWVRKAVVQKAVVE
jgi:hypothetical protein